MKKQTTILVGALLIANSGLARADQKQLSEEDKTKILTALHVLEDAGIIKPVSPDQSIQLDGSVINELMKLGLIKIENSQMHVICTGISN